MSVSAVTHYLKDAITTAGTSFEGQSIEPHIMPAPGPLQAVGTPPRAFIWPTKVQHLNPVIYGPLPRYNFAYNPMMIIIRQVIQADEALMEAFLLLVDSFCHFLHNPPVSVSNQPLVDAVTGERSDLISVGDPLRDLGMPIGITTDFILPRFISDASPVALRCNVSVAIAELVPA